MSASETILKDSEKKYFVAMVALVAAVVWSQKQSQTQNQVQCIVGECDGVEWHPHIHKLQFIALNYPPDS